MEAKPRHLVHYVTADGRDLFARWIETLVGSPALKKVLVRIDRAEDGNLGDWKAVGEGILELRIDFATGYRIYCAEDGNDLVLLTGGTKETQDSDISTAKKYWRDYNA